MHTCTHIYTHTYIHTYIHTFRQTYIQTDIQTDIHTYIHIYIIHIIHTYISFIYTSTYIQINTLEGLYFYHMCNTKTKQAIKSEIGTST